MTFRPVDEKTYAQIKSALRSGLGVEDIKVKYGVQESETRWVINRLRRIGVLRKVIDWKRIRTIRIR